MSDHVFAVLLEVPPAHEATFNTIYDTDHLLHMIEVPGVRNCARYRLDWSDNAAEMPKYLALYEIDGPEVPRSAAWKQQSAKGAWPTEMRPHVTVRRNGVFSHISYAAAGGGKVRGAKGLTQADNIYFLLQAIPAALDATFNRLYDGDHIPLMLQAPGAQACTRFKLAWSESGDVPDYLAIYEIDNTDVPRSLAWKQQTNLGAWPTQMRPNFTARRNGAFHRIGYFGPRK
jgi:hypothetical protein